MTKLVVFTCVTGGIDQLDPILHSCPLATPETRWIIFSDKVQKAQPVKGDSVTWELMPLVWRHPVNPRRSARYHKLNAHLVLPPTTLSCWMDGSQVPKEGLNLLELSEALLSAVDLAAFKHPDRQCVYQELEACIRLKKDDPPTMQQQLARYRAEGYPPFHGLVETSCVLRRHSPAILKFNALWWKELSQGSLRDQLSFNYCAWRLGLTYGHVPGCRAVSPYFYFRSHKR